MLAWNRGLSVKLIACVCESATDWGRRNGDRSPGVVAQLDLTQEEHKGHKDEQVKADILVASQWQALGAQIRGGMQKTGTFENPARLCTREGA